MSSFVCLSIGASPLAACAIGAPVMPALSHAPWVGDHVPWCVFPAGWGAQSPALPLSLPLDGRTPGSAAHGRDYPAGGIPLHLRTLRAVCAHVRVACACGLMMSRILRRRWRQMSGLRLDGCRGSHTRPANGGHSLPLHSGVKGRKKRYLLLISVLIKDTI